MLQRQRNDSDPLTTKFESLMNIAPKIDYGSTEHGLKFKETFIRQLQDVLRNPQLGENYLTRVRETLIRCTEVQQTKPLWQHELERAREAQRKADDMQSQAMVAQMEIVDEESKIDHQLLGKRTRCSENDPDEEVGQKRQCTDVGQLASPVARKHVLPVAPYSVMKKQRNINPFNLTQLLGISGLLSNTRPQTSS